MEDRAQAQARELLRQNEDFLKKLSEQLKVLWRGKSIKAVSNSDTMYNAGKVDGMCEAVDIFIGEIERIASTDE